MRFFSRKKNLEFLDNFLTLVWYIFSMPYQPLHEFLQSQASLPIKDFDSWDSIKKNLELADPDITFKEGSIWWCSLGLNIGHEQDGKHENFERPILIIKKFGSSSCLCLPLTTSGKENLFQWKIPSFKAGVFVIISQVRLISHKRLLRELGFVSKKDLRIVKNKLHSVIG